MALRTPTTTPPPPPPPPSSSSPSGTKKSSSSSLFSQFTCPSRQSPRLILQKKKNGLLKSAAIVALAAYSSSSNSRSTTTANPSPRSVVVSAAAAATTPSAVTNLAFAAGKQKKRSNSPSSPITESSSGNKKQKKPGISGISKPTESFHALWAGNLQPTATREQQQENNIKIHTLILGTHPSITSLSREQYFGHSMNAFWWIAGDCLGFRRDTAVSLSTGKPYKFSEHLRYPTSKIISYEEQVRCFCFKGFALWDVIQSCVRDGSLDSNIHKGEKPNDIRQFCEDHPTIQRIVFANGGTGTRYFCKHNRDWLETGELVPGPNKASQDQFKLKKRRKTTTTKSNNCDTDGDSGSDARTRRKITCISAHSVSPAAASLSYTEKRDFWEKYIYQPGLADFEESIKTAL